MLTSEFLEEMDEIHRKHLGDALRMFIRSGGTIMEPSFSIGFTTGVRFTLDTVGKYGEDAIAEYEKYLRGDQ